MIFMTDTYVGQVAECQTGLHSTQVHLTAFVTLCVNCSIRFACKRRVWPHRLECFAAWPSPSVNLIRAVQINPQQCMAAHTHTHTLAQNKSVDARLSNTRTSPTNAHISTRVPHV
jgi:hypothetical protein